jgi:hypothetical protein
MMRKPLAIAAICCTALTGFGIGAAYVKAQTGAAEDLPAYHGNPPSAPLPVTLDPKMFSDAQTQNIYALAAKVKPVLYQQPCYCHCDRHAGHKSLLDCLVDGHGSVCDTCEKEAVYAYKQSKLGKTPAQIRVVIIHGKWKEADLAQYNAPATSKKRDSSYRSTSSVRSSIILFSFSCAPSRFASMSADSRRRVSSRVS